VERPLLFALAFDNGLADRKSGFKRFNGNIRATSCPNLVNLFCPTTSVFTLLKRAIFCRDLPAIWRRSSFVTLSFHIGLENHNFGFSTVIGSHFCISCRNLVRFSLARFARGRHCYASRITCWALPHSSSVYFVLWYLYVFWLVKLFYVHNLPSVELFKFLVWVDCEGCCWYCCQWRRVSTLLTSCGSRQLSRLQCVERLGRSSASLLEGEWVLGLNVDLYLVCVLRTDLDRFMWVAVFVAHIFTNFVQFLNLWSNMERLLDKMCMLCRNYICYKQVYLLTLTDCATLPHAQSTLSPWTKFF